jgi:ribonuclease Z
MKRALVVVAVVLLIVAGVGYAMRAKIVTRLMGRVVTQNMQTNLLDEFGDGLHVVLCGAGSPLPDPARSGPCTAIIAGEHLYIVDAGSGSSRAMSFMRLPQGEIDGILLTHFHSDHIDGLGEMLLQRWANGGHTTPVHLYGPHGVEAVAAGLDMAYANSRKARVAHHGEAIVPSSGAGTTPVPFPVPEEGEGLVVVWASGLQITAFRVDHAPVRPAVGYRFDYKGRSVVVSGDTVKSPTVERFAQGADVLVHEALSSELTAVITEGAERAGRKRLAKITRDILDYHTSPVEAAEIARDAGVGFLLFTHIVPPLLLAPMEEMFVEGVSETFSGPVAVGRDGTVVSLPAGTDEITVRELL